MLPMRVVRPSVFLTGLLVAFLAPLHAGEDGFTSPPTPAEQVSPSVAPGLDELDRVDVEPGFPTRPQPRERPRLDRGGFLSETGRLRVHGGMSFTVGGGSGGSFHGASTWVSYHDPVTGFSLGFAYSEMSGNGYPGGYYPGYAYPRYSSMPLSPYSALRQAQPAGADRVQAPLFIRSGAHPARDGPR